MEMTTKTILSISLKISIAVTILVCFSQSSFASWYSASPIEFFIEKPGKEPSWIAGPIPGVPLILLGPSEEGFRAGLSLIPESKPSNTTINLDVIKEGFKLYKEGREKFVSDRKGKIEKFLDPFQLENSNGLEIFGLGYIYELAGQKIIEKSLRFNCEGHAVLSVYRAGQNSDKKYYKKFEKVIKSLRCRGLK